MDKNKLWIIGSVFVMVVVIVLGWILGIQPQLAAGTAADEERAAVETTNDGHVALLDRLKSDFKDVKTLKRDFVSLGKSVPAGTAMPAFVDQVDALAGENQVTLTGMTVADAQAYKPVAAVVGVPAVEAASTPGASEAAAPAPAPVSPAGVPPVTNTRITTSNFASMKVDITIAGGYGRVLDFVSGLQNGSRLFLVDGLSTRASEGGPGTVSATVSGLVYVLVPPGAALPAAPAPATAGPVAKG